MKNSLLAVVIASLFFIACDGENDNQRFTEEDNGRTVQISDGSEFKVDLEGNPSTGFGWVVEQYDPQIITPEFNVEFTPYTDAIGSAGRLVQRFETQRPGQTPLRMSYRRSFEQGVEPENTFELQIVVTE